MPRIPIWTSKHHKIDIDCRQSFSHKLFSKFSGNIGLHKDKSLLVYMDQHIIIINIYNELDQLQETEPIYSILYRSHKFNDAIIIRKPIYACIYNKINKLYYLLSDNLSARYQLLIYNMQQNKVQQQQIKGIKPVRKKNAIVYFIEKTQKIIICSSSAIHQWQKTGAIWQYSLTANRWQQKLFQKQSEVLRNKGWIFCIQDYMYILNNEHLVINDGINITKIYMQGLKVDREDDRIISNWNQHQECFYIIIKKHNKLAKQNNMDNIILKLNKNSIQRLDLGIVLKEETNRQNTKNSIYKNQQQNIKSFINYQTKMEIRQNQLYLYTPISFNYARNIQIQYTQFHINLHQLQILPSLATPNIQLKQYFINKKYAHYADLILLTQKKQVLCSKQLFQFYSPKFKKLYSNTTNSKNLGDGPINLKLDHAKLHTVYFLVEQLYHEFTLPISNLDQSIIYDLMILSHKFQIRKLQSLCQLQIQPNLQNFVKLFDYIRNSQTLIFKESLIRFFVIHSQELIKIMPIGKVQELIRLMYTPQCQHNAWTQFGFKIQNKYSIKYSQRAVSIQNPKSINYPPLIRNQQAQFHVCDKCRRILDYCDQHRKNKSTNRSNVSVISMGSQSNHKKDNNSN